eukprot:gene10276-11332_t
MPFVIAKKAKDQSLSEILQERLQVLCLAPVDVGGSGDGLFKAVSHQLHSAPDMHKNLRLIAISHAANPALCEQTVAASGFDWETYLERMSIEGIWCDNIIIQAVANSLSCVVHITHAFRSSEEPILVVPVNECS